MVYENGRFQVENVEQFKFIFVKSLKDFRRVAGSKYSKILVEENNHG
jgi:hypothetical protein